MKWNRNEYFEGVKMQEISALIPAVKFSFIIISSAIAAHTCTMLCWLCCLLVRIYNTYTNSNTQKISSTYSHTIPVTVSPQSPVTQQVSCLEVTSHFAPTSKQAHHTEPHAVDLLACLLEHYACEFPCQDHMSQSIQALLAHTRTGLNKQSISSVSQQT